MTQLSDAAQEALLNFYTAPAAPGEFPQIVVKIAPQIANTAEERVYLRYQGIPGDLIELHRAGLVLSDSDVDELELFSFDTREPPAWMASGTVTLSLTDRGRTEAASVLKNRSVLSMCNMLRDMYRYTAVGWVYWPKVLRLSDDPAYGKWWSHANLMRHLVLAGYARAEAVKAHVTGARTQVFYLTPDTGLGAARTLHDARSARVLTTGGLSKPPSNSKGCEAWRLLYGDLCRLDIQKILPEETAPEAGKGWDGTVRVYPNESRQQLASLFGRLYAPKATEVPLSDLGCTVFLHAQEDVLPAKNPFAPPEAKQASPLDPGEIEEAWEVWNASDVEDCLKGHLGWTQSGFQILKDGPHWFRLRDRRSSELRDAAYSLVGLLEYLNEHRVRKPRAFRGRPK